MPRTLLLASLVNANTSFKYLFKVTPSSAPFFISSKIFDFIFLNSSFNSSLLFFSYLLSNAFISFTLAKKVFKGLIDGKKYN